MSEGVGRREAVGRLVAAAAGAAFPGAVLRGQDEEFLVDGRPVEIVVDELAPETVRIRVLPLSSRSVVEVATDGALANGEPSVEVARRRSGGRFEVRGSALVVRFRPELPSIVVESASGEKVQELTLSHHSSGMSFRLGTGPLLGMGQGGPQFDRRGSKDEMRSGQGGYQLHTHGGRVPIQWLVGTDGFAMFLHRPLGSFDLTGDEGRFVPFAEGLPLDLFVVFSRDPSKVMAEYARITGFPELPPLWSFGYLQSHRTLAGEQEIVSIARTFREKKLPCDALIYLGTGFCPSGWNTANGSFAFHPGNFPDPVEVLGELHRAHFRVVLHIVLLAQRLRGSVSDSCELGRFDEEEVGCYWNLHRKLLALGIDGFWPDEGDALDAEARLTRNRMYWEGPQLDRPNERPFALHRNGYAGMQRYASFLWSGDVYSTWETLRIHVSVAINTGLSGIPYWGTDIGGFVPTAEYTSELHVRWFQFGAFCPLFRAHGRTWHLRLPWGWGMGELGPDELTTANYSGGARNPDASELRRPEVEPILRKYLELRYRLLPYIYTLARESHDTGMPMMRALWLHESEDPDAVARGDEYLFGPDLLVAPVTEKGASSRRLYLPRGVWIDFWTEERFEGGREIERAVDLETIPLFVRAGAILPLGPVKQYSGESVDAPLTLVLYPGGDAERTLYEDDGISFDYRRGEWTRIDMKWRAGARRLTLARGRDSRPLSKRAIEVRVAGETAARSVVFDGAVLELDL
jgi:alpha-glucosidase (family GH31 glycosyl hydrolase)